MDLTLKEGRFLVRFTREEIDAHFGGKKPKVPESMKGLMSRKPGVFVRLNRYPKHTLRGSFGYTGDILPLREALSEASIFAAFRDHRFHPLRGGELKATLIEVSILSTPKLIPVKDPREYMEKIKVGRDGVIVETNSLKGVILPQIPLESNWSSTEFLSRACMMSGLGPDAWRIPNTRIYKFNAQVFAEEEPGGVIVEKKILESIR